MYDLSKFNPFAEDLCVCCKGNPIHWEGDFEGYCLECEEEEKNEIYEQSAKEQQKRNLLEGLEGLVDDVYSYQELREILEKIDYTKRILHNKLMKMEYNGEV